MAPRQTTAKQTKIIIGQILSLIDSLDVKALKALEEQYLSRAFIHKDEALHITLVHNYKLLQELRIFKGTRTGLRNLLKETKQ